METFAACSKPWATHSRRGVVLGGPRLPAAGLIEQMTPICVAVWSSPLWHGHDGSVVADGPCGHGTCRPISDKFVSATSRTTQTNFFSKTIFFTPAARARAPHLSPSSPSQIAREREERPAATGVEAGGGLGLEIT